MIIDTHAHYDDSDFDEDRDSLLRSMKEAGVGLIVNMGASLKGCRDTIALTEQYDFIYGAIGVHPSDTDELDEDRFNWLKDNCSHSKIVAVGEIGLDYHYPEPPVAVQKKWFQRQLDLAREVRLPVVIHSREAAQDTLDIMKALRADEIGGVIHCFSYGVEMAKEYVNMGFYIGVGGVVTFKNGKKLKEVVEYLPIERIVLETDCPYLSPEPNRGKRNSSLNLPYVVKTIAEIKGMTEDAVIRYTEENARKLYHIKQ
jgi:TatD DNase family protein